MHIFKDTFNPQNEFYIQFQGIWDELLWTGLIPFIALVYYNSKIYCKIRFIFRFHYFPRLHIYGYLHNNVVLTHYYYYWPPMHVLYVFYIYYLALNCQNWKIISINKEIIFMNLLKISIFWLGLQRITVTSSSEIRRFAGERIITTSNPKHQHHRVLRVRH